jgi:hypothetical protein
MFVKIYVNINYFHTKYVKHMLYLDKLIVYQIPLSLYKQCL